MYRASYLREELDWTERQRRKRLSEHYTRERSRRLQRERREIDAQLTDEQKALVPEVDFGFMDEEGPTPFDIWQARQRGVQV